MVRSLRLVVCLLLGFSASLSVAVSPANGGASEPASGAQAEPAIHTVEINPPRAEAEVGQRLQFTAVVKDAAGRVLDEKPSRWFAVPFDLAGADEAGRVTVFGPGEVRVGALVGTKTGYARIRVNPPPVTRMEIAPVGAPIVVGGAAQLTATPRIARGDPRTDVVVEWSSDAPAVASVDAAGLVTGVAPGRATLRARTGQASGTVVVEVVRNPVHSLSVEPRSTRVRTGDVVRFAARALDSQGRPVQNLAVRWSVSGEGAQVWDDGGFVAEQPGSYVVKATLGERAAVASVVVTPRNVERALEVVGRVRLKDVQAAEQWIIGNTAFLSTVADQVHAYDISDPAQPKLLGSVQVDARLVNDVSTTADGRIGVITREGASNRKNGIAFLDTANPAQLKVLSEYTETVTGGVHSAFVNGHYVYLTDDATGSLRIIDFRDLRAPREVARWQTESPQVTVEGPTGQVSSGRYLHDVQVLDGLAYLAYWRDGLVILDVGNGLKGGSPERPQLVGQLRFNYHELYGDGWLAGAHAVFRYRNYVFVGDEVFPAQFDIAARTRIPVRGVMHVVDVSDPTRPRKVAEYPVPEAGAHNIWAENDILYMGYYNGGGRVLDVSGELRGDLYRQGREIARLWTGDPEGYRPNMPFVWGAQPHRGLVFYNDMNSGLWIVRLGSPRFKGQTTEPPL